VIEENIRQKILDLVARSHSLSQSSTGIARDSYHLSQCRGWITEALNVIRLAVPMPNNPYRQNIENLPVTGDKNGALPVARRRKR
jgi:hypothetical protein